MGAARDGILVDSLPRREKAALEVKHARNRRRELLPTAAAATALLITTVLLVAVVMIQTAVLVGLATGYNEPARVDSDQLPHVRFEQSQSLGSADLFVRSCALFVRLHFCKLTMRFFGVEYTQATRDEECIPMISDT